MLKYALIRPGPLSSVLKYNVRLPPLGASLPGSKPQFDDFRRRVGVEWGRGGTSNIIGFHPDGKKVEVLIIEIFRDSFLSSTLLDLGVSAGSMPRRAQRWYYPI